jgi:hypothetical protein
MNQASAMAAASPRVEAYSKLQKAGERRQIRKSREMAEWLPPLALDAVRTSILVGFEDDGASG